jgi:hypothetical protein
MKIEDLTMSRELDDKAMSALRGGFFYKPSFGGDVDIDIDVAQGITQNQNVEVNVLNGASIGVPLNAFWGGLALDVSPEQAASTEANIDLRSYF